MCILLGLEYIAKCTFFEHFEMSFGVLWLFFLILLYFVSLYKVQVHLNELECREKVNFFL